MHSPTQAQTGSSFIWVLLLCLQMSEQRNVYDEPERDDARSDDDDDGNPAQSARKGEIVYGAGASAAEHQYDEPELGTPHPSPVYAASVKSKTGPPLSRGVYHEPQLASRPSSPSSSPRPPAVDDDDAPPPPRPPRSDAVGLPPKSPHHTGMGIDSAPPPRPPRSDGVGSPPKSPRQLGVSMDIPPPARTGGMDRVADTGRDVASSSPQSPRLLSNSIGEYDDPRRVHGVAKTSPQVARRAPLAPMPLEDDDSDDGDNAVDAGTDAGYNPVDPLEAGSDEEGGVRRGAEGDAADPHTFTESDNDEDSFDFDGGGGDGDERKAWGTTGTEGSTETSGVAATHSSDPMAVPVISMAKIYDQRSLRRGAKPTQPQAQSRFSWHGGPPQLISEHEALPPLPPTSPVSSSSLPAGVGASRQVPSGAPHRARAATTSGAPHRARVGTTTLEVAAQNEFKVMLPGVRRSQTMVTMYV